MFSGESRWLEVLFGEIPLLHCVLRPFCSHPSVPLNTIFFKADLRTDQTPLLLPALGVGTCKDSQCQGSSAQGFSVSDSGQEEKLPSTGALAIMPFSSCVVSERACMCSRVWVRQQNGKEGQGQVQRWPIPYSLGLDSTASMDSSEQSCPVCGEQDEGTDVLSC